jgi:SAM-dependent methyltransferase
MQYYPDNVNPAAYSMIVDQILPRRVERQAIFLEFGCSTGALGSAILQGNPDIQWVGLDYNPDALSIAQQRLSYVAQVNFNELSEMFFTSLCIQPDFLIMVDVLEHVYEPKNFLENITRVFPSANILCVLPNIACYQTYDRLSIHDFSYDDYGIFDKTHKTFYTHLSAQSLFCDFGYNVRSGPLYLPDPVVSTLLDQDICYPYIFTRGKYSLLVETRDELVSLCSYGFCFLFTPST